jgi:hypothetical protein
MPDGRVRRDKKGGRYDAGGGPERLASFAVFPPRRT